MEPTKTLTDELARAATNAELQLIGTSVGTKAERDVVRRQQEVDVRWANGMITGNAKKLINAANSYPLIAFSIRQALYFSDLYQDS